MSGWFVRRRLRRAVVIAVAGWAVKDLHRVHGRPGSQPVGQPVAVRFQGVPREP
jgi:hypothetical protein